MKNNNFENLEKYLSNLGTMFKKRGKNSDGFKSLLRSSLADKALSAADSHRKQNGFRQIFFNRMLPVTAALLVILLLVQIVLPGGRGDLLPKLVDTAFAYEQFQLEATDQDLTGVNTESGFLLTSKKEINANELKNVLIVTPVAEFTWKQVSANEILLTPKTELREGEVYRFSLNTEMIKSLDFAYEYDWAFQISDDLRVRYTIPGNQLTSIPVNSGIEMNLTYSGIDLAEVAKYWEITPIVQGKFEAFGKSLVFIPAENLQEETLYTVKLKAGLPVKDSEKTLLRDYVFQFETGREVYDQTGELNFTREAFDFAPNGQQELSFYYSDYNNYNLERDYFSLKAYKFATGEDYLEARKLMAEKVPHWTNSQSKKAGLDLEALNLVQEVSDLVGERETSYSFFVLKLPENLTKGYYILDVKGKDGLEDQVFVQVSDTAVYYDFRPEDSVIWVNDLVSGKPAVKAELNLGEKINEVTANDGTVRLKDTAQQLEVYKDENYVSVPLTVKLNDFVTYYLVDFYDYASGLSQKNWQLMASDRGVYHPSDTVNYWFFAQGKNEKLSGKAELLLVEENLILFDYKGQTNWVNVPELIEPVYTKEITLRDGVVVSGNFKIDNLDQGRSYRLGVKQNGEWLTSKYISVQDFVKPAYELSLDTKNRLLYPKETFDVTLSAKFFDGTPVADTRVALQEKPYRTNAKGEVFISKQKPESSEYDYGLISYQYFNARALGEETANIFSSMNLLMYRSNAVADKLEFTTNGFSTQIRELDLSKVDRSQAVQPDQSEDILADPIAGIKVTAVLNQNVWEKIEQGEYYDPIEKVTRKTYYYSQKEVPLEKVSLVSDAKGNIAYNFAEPLKAVGADASYNLQLFITDQEGNSYTESAYLGQSYYPTERVAYKLEADKDIAKENEQIVAKVVSDQELPQTANYLYTEATQTAAKFSVTKDATYNFKFSKDKIPQVKLGAVIFDGVGFTNVEQAFVGFDYSERMLSVDVSADKESYAPGEEVELEIQLKEKNSNKPVAGYVNLNLVDEAYYALYAESLLDPLANIYSYDYDSKSFSYASHASPNAQDIRADQGGCFVAGTKILMADGSYKNIEQIKVGDFVLTRKSEFNEELVASRVNGLTVKPVTEYMLVNGTLGITGEHVLFVNNQWRKAEKLKAGDVLLDKAGKAVRVESIVMQKAKAVNVYNFEVDGYHTYFANDLYVHNDKGGRVDFQDTAYFEVVETDRSGKGKVKFKLPDNITEWRVSAVAISGGDDIFAGNNSVGLKVTKPLFALPTLKESYLAADQPLIPLRAFGTLLQTNQDVTFKMAIDSLTKFVTQEGKAFQNTYFDLGKLAIGPHKATFEVEALKESDRITLPFVVKQSNLTKQLVAQQKLQDGTKLIANTNTNNRIAVDFVASELSAIYDLLWQGVSNNSARADYAVAKELAADWLKEYFAQENFVTPIAFTNYQKTSFSENFDGGIALLPYADTSLELSTKLALLDATKWNSENLQTYFEYELAQTNTLLEKLQALAGMAALGKPVLAEIEILTKNKELNFEEKLWTAIALNASLDRAGAAKYFTELSAPENVGDQFLLAYLAVELKSTKQAELWENALKSNKVNADQTGEGFLLEQYLYIKSRLDLIGLEDQVEFRLNGKKIALKAGEIYTVNYLPEQLRTAKINGIKGDLSAVLRYTTAVDSLAELLAGTDASLQMTREYLVNDQSTTEFKAGQLIKVAFNVSVPEIEFANGYNITDVLPSGLSPVTQPYYTFNDSTELMYPYYQQGQTSRFSLYCDPKAESVKGKCTEWRGYYWARVVNAGRFVAEPALIEKNEDVVVYNLSDGGKNTKIVIDKTSS